MGIDYGKKRVGIAFTDDGGQMAFPHGVLKNTPDLLKEIISLAEEKNVAEIVIGYSLGKDGKPNEIQSQISELVTDLTLHLGLPVHLQPEMYTTQEAIRFQGRNENTDAAAASIILNSFITKSK